MCCTVLLLEQVAGELNQTGHYRQCKAYNREKEVWGREIHLVLQPPSFQISILLLRSSFKVKAQSSSFQSYI